MVFLFLGLLVGGLGTLIGVGGGFLLVPLLFFIHPTMPPSEVTAVSLFCVTLNAFSGSSQYALKRLIHYRSGIIFALASFPGAWIGVGLTHAFEREKFEFIYAVLLTLLGFYLLIKSKSQHGRQLVVPPHLSNSDYIKGGLASFGVGFIASFFGVGGGIIHVPFLHGVLGFPVHFATGTSQFILALTSLVAVLQHYFKGSLDLSPGFVAYLAIGMVVGAQISARFSKKINAVVIMRILAVAILMIAMRIFIIYSFNIR